jgi:hypothetical protein
MAATSFIGLKDMYAKLKTIPDNQIPNININTFFNAATVPTTCDAIVASARRLTYPNFTQGYKIVDSKDDPSQRVNDMKTNLSLFRDALVSTPIDQGEPIDAGGNKNILNYINKVQNNQIPVLRQVNQCLREASEPNMNALEQQRNDTNESKTRLEFITNADKNVSYYDGWFPMFRPMTEGSLFGLFATSIFLLLLSTAILLQFAGISLDITFPSFGESEEGTSYTPYILGGIALSATVALLQWYFQK